MRKKVQLSLLLWFFLLVQTVLAQSQTVTGRVSDAKDDSALPGVSVVVKGTSSGTITDAEGRYSLAVPPGSTLIFSYIGYLSKEVPVAEATTLNVKLETDVKSLSEVVVTGFGINRDKKALGYSATTIQGTDVVQTQRENFLNALQGRVAGATITPSTGQPGASAQIILRGAVSFDGDNQPLFVVDGLPISNRTFSQSSLVSNGANRDNDYSNRAMDLNPQDIESITVLKGPEAAALFGTNGASGAIVITTKKAKAGKGSISYDNNFRVEKVYRFPEVQTTYGPGLGGFIDPEDRVFFGSRYPEDMPLYDNIDAFFRTGFTQKHNLIFSGGNEQASFRLSTNYTDQSGTVPTTTYKKFSAMLSSSAKINRMLSVNGFMNYVSARTQKASKGTGSYLLSVLTWPRTDDMTNYLTPEGTRRFLDPTAVTTEWDNPFWNVNKNVNSDKTDRLIGNVSLMFDPLKWLNITGRLGADVYTTLGNNLLHPQSFDYFSPKLNAGGYIENYTENSRLLSGSLVASIKGNIGKFSPIIRIGGNFEDNRYETNSVSGQKFYDPNFNSINNTDPTTQRTRNAVPHIRKVGLFANSELGYNEFLYLTLTGRLDGSSTLEGTEDGMYFFYPAASVSFVFSELAALQHLKWLWLGKLRASYGWAGKDPRAAYVTRPRLTPQTSTGGGFALDAIGGNDKLKAEFTRSAEVGAELKFLEGRLGVDVSYYDVRSDKQITSPRLSYGTGYVLKYINGGEITNKGFELDLTGTPLLRKNFSWDVSLRLGSNRSKITAMPAGLETLYLSDTWIFNVRGEYKLGASLYSLSAMRYLKNDQGQLLINPTSGLPIRDGNFYVVADRQPDFTAGITNSFTYKNFNLSFLLDVRKGGDVFNGNELYMYIRGLSKLTLDRETPRVIEGVLRDGFENSENPTVNTIMVTPYIQNTYYVGSYSEEDFIERDVHWLRLRDVTLAYNLPQSLLGRQKAVQTASIFVTGTDLFMITNYKGADPSVSALNTATGGVGGYGYDYGSLALPRGVNMGIRIGL